MAELGLNSSRVKLWVAQFPIQPSASSRRAGAAASPKQTRGCAPLGYSTKVTKPAKAGPPAPLFEPRHPSPRRPGRQRKWTGPEPRRRPPSRAPARRAAAARPMPGRGPGGAAAPAPRASRLPCPGRRISRPHSSESCAQRRALGASPAFHAFRDLGRMCVWGATCATGVCVGCSGTFRDLGCVRQCVCGTSPSREASGARSERRARRTRVLPCVLRAARGGETVFQTKVRANIPCWIAPITSTMPPLPSVAESAVALQNCAVTRTESQIH
jgi:hypothetical protein